MCVLKKCNVDEKDEETELNARGVECLSDDENQTKLLRQLLKKNTQYEGTDDMHIPSNQERHP